MSSLSLASRQAASFEGELQELLGFAAMAFPPINPPPQASFPVLAASGFWVSGVAVLAVLAVGAGHVALNKIRTIPASAGVNAASASIQKAEAKTMRAKKREEEQTAVAAQVPEHNERPARRIG